MKTRAIVGIAWSVVLIGACSSAQPGATDAGNDSAPAADASADVGALKDASASDIAPGADADAAQAPTCQLTSAFQPPIALAGTNVNTPNNESVGSLSSDELTIYFDRLTANNIDIYVATRAAKSDAFGPATPITNVNGPLDDARPSVTADGLVMYFLRFDTNTSQLDIFVSTRSNTSSDFGIPVAVAGTQATNYTESQPYITPDGTTLYYTQYGATSGILKATCGSDGGCSNPTVLSEFTVNGDPYSFPAIEISSRVVDDVMIRRRPVPRYRLWFFGSSSSVG